MLKETEETIVFFVTFLSLVAFQLGEGGPGPINSNFTPPDYAMVQNSNGLQCWDRLRLSVDSHWFPPFFTSHAYKKQYFVRESVFLLIGQPNLNTDTVHPGFCKNTSNFLTFFQIV